MDEIIQILVFAGAMILSVVIQGAKNKKKKESETASPQEVLEEVFPDLKTFQEPVPAEPQPVVKPVSKPKRKSAKPKDKPSPPMLSAVSAPPPKQAKIRLNTREEAKRAFIYSEIFNRKY